MSNERQETVSDIVAEMRKYADSMEKHLIYDLRECSTDYLRVLADRIETAHSRFYDKYKEHTNELNRQILVLKREIETLRALVEGLLKASSIDCASCGYDCGPRRENCITKKAIVYLEGHS